MLRRLFAVLVVVLLATAGFAEEIPAPDDTLKFDPAHTPAGVKPIVVWLNGTTLETTACFIADTNPDAITCTPPAAEGQSQCLCEGTDAGTGGADCVCWKAPADVETGDYIYYLDSKGRIPGHAVMPAIGWVERSADFDCVTPDPDECDSSDHIQFDLVVLETDTAIIDCDTSTTYTTTADVASVGRCQLKVAGTYMVEASPQLEFVSAAKMALIDVFKSTATQDARGFRYFFASATTATTPFDWTKASEPGVISSVFTVTAASWIEVRIATVFAGGDVTKVYRGSWFRVTRLY